MIANPQAVARALEAAYPPLLKEAGVEGMVTVRFRVSEAGVPEEVSVVSTPHPALGEAAVRALAVARFAPARARGEAKAVWITLPVSFRVARAEAAARAEVAGVRELSETDVPPRLANVEAVSRALVAAYPPLLRAAGVGGRVDVALVVREDGGVRALEVTHADRAELASAAVRVAETMRFTPARIDGRAAETRIVVPVVFQPAEAVPAPNR